MYSGFISSSHSLSATFSQPSLSPLAHNQSITRLEYQQLFTSYKKQNEYIQLMNQKVLHLEEKNASLRDRMLSIQAKHRENSIDKKTACSLSDKPIDPMEGTKTSENGGLIQLKKEHDTALLILGEKQTEIQALKEDLSHVNTMFREQICVLLDQIEDLKKKT